MNNPTNLNENIQSLVSDFFERYEIRSISIEKGLGITNSTEISDINLLFITEQDDPGSNYTVEFKLQRECADISQTIKAIHTEPEFSIELTPQSDNINPEELNEKLRSFIDTIRDRVISALKEQTVQNISYVGNTFILNNSTRFKVLSDEGEGRLNIEVLTLDKPLDALLTASGLLDGLYSGSIKLVESDLK